MYNLFQVQPRKGFLIFYGLENDITSGYITGHDITAFCYSSFWNFHLPKVLQSSLQLAIFPSSLHSRERNCPFLEYKFMYYGKNMGEHSSVRDIDRVESVSAPLRPEQ